MRNCTNCMFASWKRTKAGKLHPSGDGSCMMRVKLPPLPQSFYWVYNADPRPLGGHINRKKELKDHCAYFARKMEEFE